MQHTTGGNQEGGLYLSELVDYRYPSGLIRLATGAVGLPHYIIHELLANWADLLGQGGTEHHHLLLMWGGLEYFLHISSHVCKSNISTIVITHNSCSLTKLIQHFITLVQNEVLQVFRIESLVTNQCEYPARSPNNYVRTVVLQGLFVFLDGNPTKEYGNLYVIEVLAKTLVLLVYLKGQFSVGN